MWRRRFIAPSASSPKQCCATARIDPCRCCRRAKSSAVCLREISASNTPLPRKSGGEGRGKDKAWRYVATYALRRERLLRGEFDPDEEQIATVLAALPAFAGKPIFRKAQLRLNRQH